VKLEKLFGTFFGIGYFPIAPATLASLVIIVLLYLLQLNNFFLLVISAGLFFSGARLANTLEREIGSDPKIFVLDEVSAMIVAVLFLPRTITFYLLAFAFFRIFDILKPYPISSLERVKNGYGVMLDDLLSGVCANLVLQIGRFIFRL